MAREYWFPKTLDGQQNLFMNVKDKLPTYQADFNLTQAEVDRMTDICVQCLYIIEYTREAKSTVQGLLEWRKFVFEEGEVGKAAPVAPVFETFTPPVGLTTGLFDEFRAMVDLIKKQPNFTDAAGEDIGFVGHEIVPEPPSEMKPALTYSTNSGYEVTVKGKMQGTDALRLEFRRNGTSEWVNAAFLTGTPATFVLPPENPGQPEIGDIRARFIKKNTPIGEYSDLVTITVSP